MNRSTAVNVQTFINEHPFSPFQWLIFFMCFIIVLLDGFDTAAIGFIAPSLIAEWGITKPALAPVLSAALFGLACGALVSGPLSDRLGRRSLLLASVLLFGVACFASAFSNSIEHLTILRFVTGVGLGAAMPNAVTMMGEYCPDRRRATLINLMFCGFPLGAAFGGFLAAWMIPHFGWRSVLLLGGITPLVLLVVAAAEAAGVGALHGRQQPAGRTHSRGACAHFERRSAGRQLRDDRNRAANRRQGPRRGAVALIHRRLGDAVACLLHGSRDFLCVDQLDADPAERTPGSRRSARR